MNATQAERIVRQIDDTQKLIAKRGMHSAIKCFRCCCSSCFSFLLFFFFFLRTVYNLCCLQENYTHEFGRTSPQVNCSWLEYDVSEMIIILPLDDQFVEGFLTWTNQV